MTAPDFLVVGHALQDLIGEGDEPEWRLGGAVAYASALSKNLGLRTAVLTSTGPDMEFERLLPGVDCCVIPSERTTQFRNIYEDGHRRQMVPQRAGVTLASEHVPDGWLSAGIVLLGPVVGEVADDVAACFANALIGVGAQGFLREIDDAHRVRPVSPDRWEAEGHLREADVLFVSDEDVGAEESAAAIERWTRMVDIVAFTRGYQGADVHCRGEQRHIDAFPANAVDLTGAGDVFAAAFLVRLRESDDVWDATRFAVCAASFVVEAEGIEAMPTRDQIEARLRENPGITAIPTDDQS
jgi:sugar/nucleoside kinase (ribokinase family)